MKVIDVNQYVFGKWIPVTEGIPVPYKQVLVSTIYTLSDYSGITDSGVHMGQFTWQWDVFVDHNPEKYSVVAWMPLPEPYMEEVEND